MKEGYNIDGGFDTIIIIEMYIGGRKDKTTTTYRVAAQPSWRPTKPWDLLTAHMTSQFL